MFEITIMVAFLLTVITVIGYEAYWEYREEKSKQHQINRLARKAVEIYGNHIPEELETYIQELKGENHDEIQNRQKSAIEQRSTKGTV